jgi:hypothetical protein
MSYLVIQGSRNFVPQHELYGYQKNSEDKSMSWEFLEVEQAVPVPYKVLSPVIRRGS